MPSPAFPVLFGGALPRWAIGADLATDYTIGRDYGPTRGMFPPGVDTHAASIYAPSSVGIYQPFGANVPVLSNLGLQTVPTRTQLCAVNPVDFTTWANTNLTVTAAATTAPDGTLTGSLLDDAVAGGVHSSAASFSAVSGTTYTASFLVKDVDRRYVQILFGSAGHGVNAYANFDLQAGVLGTVGSAATATITAVGAWYLITCTAPATATTGGSFQLALITSATSARAENYTGTNKKIYAWSGQCEAAAFAASRILTASATVNGNQQVISGLGPQLATGVAGLVQVTELQLGSAGAERLLEFDDGTNNNRFLIVTNATQVVAIATAGGVAQATIADNYVPGVGTLVTIAFIITTNYCEFRIVGRASPGPDTTVTFPVMDRLALGGRGIDAVSNNYQRTRKLALEFLAPSDDPATKFAEWFAKAQLAATS